MDPNAYNFINQQGGNQPASTAGASQKKRIVIAVVGLILLLIVGLIFYSVVFGNQKTSTQILLPVAASQADLIALTTEGTRDARTTKIQNINGTTALVISTHSSQISGYLGKDSSKQIAAYQNSDFTKALADARQAGNFDSAFEALLSTRLDLYQQTLITAYNEIETPEIKKLLEQQYSQVSTLRGQPTSPQE